MAHEDKPKARPHRNLFKRGRVWWIDFTDRGGRRIRQSLETEVLKEAKECRCKLPLW